jgi:hypothetical protein
MPDEGLQEADWVVGLMDHGLCLHGEREVPIYILRLSI